MTDTLFCDVCKTDQPVEEFRKPGKPAKFHEPGYHLSCKTCRYKPVAKAARQARPRPSASVAKQRKFLKHAGIAASCACCKETLREALSLKQQDDGTYTTLCMNCKWLEGRLGICPHQTGGDF